MGGIIYPIGYLRLAPFVIFIIQVLAGMLMYLSASIISKNEAFIYLRSTIKGILKR